MCFAHSKIAQVSLSPADQFAFNAAHMSHQAKVENANNPIKVWMCLKTTSRGDIYKHNQAFKIYAHLSQIKMKFSKGVQ
jgi:hypothetical protein